MRWELAVRDEKPCPLAGLVEGFLLSFGDDKEWLSEIAQQIGPIWVYLTGSNG
jgi:hypothetical protein